MNYTVSNEAQLRAAIIDANTRGDPSSTITLTADITLGSSTTFATVTSPIVINTGEFELIGANGTGISGAGGDIIMPGGMITISSFSALKGGSADPLNSSGAGGAGLINSNGRVENHGIVVGGTGGRASQSGTAGNAAGNGGRGVVLTDGTLINHTDGVIAGGHGGNFDAEYAPGGAGGGRTGSGGVGLTMNGGGVLDNRGLITGGDGGIFGHMPATGDNYVGGAGGTGAILQGGGLYTNSGTIKGGRGSEGSNAGVTGHGTPGVGVQLGADGRFYNSAEGVIRGGDGRNGGGTLGAGNRGANGLEMGTNTYLENKGSINGGNAGPLMGAAARGGTAITGAGDVEIINSGIINAGRNGDDSHATAVEFSGGNNTLELRSGYAIYGNVLAGATDTFALGGSVDDSFNVSKIGPVAQFQGFGIYEKRGTSTWILTGTTTAVTPWTIYDGVLQVSQDGNLGHPSGLLTFDGGTLRTTAPFTSGRNILVKSGGGTIQTLADLTHTGVIGGTGQLVKNGNASLILEGDSTGFGGSTFVEAGTLVVNGSLCGSMNVLPNGRLQGIGTVCDTSNMGVVAPGNGIGTLTIHGNYAGNGGILEIEAVLGDDYSPADLLVITGDTSGHTNVDVINHGGEGALTHEGIKVIDVGGVSDGTFAVFGDYPLHGTPVKVYGAYAYGLYKNGFSTPDDGDWYLRSHYQAGVPIYETYASTLQSFNVLGTLQQRMGNRSWTTVPALVEKGMPTEYGLIEGNGFWGRMEVSGSTYSPKISTTGVEYDLTDWRMQAGGDMLLAEEPFGSLVGSASFHYGTISSDVTSFYGEGSIDSTGYGVGGALTWYASNEFYLDGQGQATWYESDLHSDTAGIDLTTDHNAFGYGLSIEAGKRFSFGPRWSTTPQAQFAYSRVNIDDFVDPFHASVNFDRSESLLGRLGITVDRQSEWLSSQGRANRSHLYGIANLYYDFADRWHFTVARTPFEHQNEEMWGGLGIGGTVNMVDDKYSVYGEAQAKTSFENFGDSHTVSGTLGFRVGW